MSKTRLSLLHVVFYLSTTGLALLVAPMDALRLLGSTGQYEPVMTRGVGTFMGALSVIVLQSVRHRVTSSTRRRSGSASSSSPPSRPSTRRRATRSSSSSSGWSASGSC